MLERCRPIGKRLNISRRKSDQAARAPWRIAWTLAGDNGWKNLLRLDEKKNAAANCCGVFWFLRTFDG
jgi:hypothetical protein